MGVRYERWRHKALGEFYDVRLEERRVTGVTGPLNAAALDRTALPHLDYDEDLERCRWLQERESEYLLVE